MEWYIKAFIRASLLWLDGGHRADRREWGLRWNQALETGGVLVADKVRIEGEVQFVREGE